MKKLGITIATISLTLSATTQFAYAATENTPCGNVANQGGESAYDSCIAAEEPLQAPGFESGTASSQAKR